MIKKLVAFPLLLTVLVSCTGAKNEDFRIQIDGKEKILPREETLVINNGFFFPSFDWNRTSLLRSLLPIHNVMEGLISYDFSDKKNAIRPALAQSWKQLENGKVWEFQLRKNLKWSDGKNVSAQHFLDHILYQLEPENGFRGVEILFKIKNAESFYKGEVKKEQLGIKVVDKNTLRYTLEKPFFQFPSYMVLTAFLPIRLDYIEKHQEDWGNRVDIPVTGPFKPLHIANSGEVFLERNEKFYGESPQFKYMKIMPIEDQGTAARLFSKNKIDINFEIPPHLVKKKHASIQSRPTLAVLVLAFNMQKPSFQNFGIRNTLAKGTRRSNLVSALGSEFIAYRSLYPEIAPGSEQIPKIKETLVPKDLESLKRLNKENLKITTWKIPICETAAETIQHQWEKDLGFRVEIDITPHKIMLSKLKKLDFDMAVLPFTSIVEDPGFIMEYIEFATYGADPPEKVLDAISSANATENFDERMKKFVVAEKQFQKELPSIPLLMIKKSVQVQESVKNYHMGNFGYFPMKDVRLER